MDLGIETRLSDQIARYLDLATSEAKLTAANMANIDTPGYKAVGMDFEAEMHSAMAGVDQGQMPARCTSVPSTGLSRAPTATMFPWTARVSTWPRRS